MINIVKLAIDIDVDYTILKIKFSLTQLYQKH